MTGWRSSHALAFLFALVFGFGGVLAATPGDPQAEGLGRDPGMEVLHGAHVMRVKGGGRPTGGSTPELIYRGGVNGTGVETGSDAVYLIYWGSQWVNNDPSDEATVQQHFFSGVVGSGWNNSVTQYCQGVVSGTVMCDGSGTPVPNGGVLAGIWYDDSSPAPRHPNQSDLGAEAVAAAAHFNNLTPDANSHVQYVINTASRNNSSGFGSSYCAYHSSASSSLGRVAYTNMPYITDAGANCGADFNGLGAKAGITIVGGHEFAETETDIFPSAGWTDKNGAENADKCAWISSGQGAAASVLLGGFTLPVQSLWSNAFNGGAGGCVLSY